MAEAVEMGHDHKGRPLFRDDKGDLWDDLAIVAAELNEPDAPENKLVMTVSWEEICRAGHWVPRYWTNPAEFEAPEGRFWVSLGTLVDEEIIRVRKGHGSPSSDSKGKGSIPYFRTSDVVNWELYRNPTALLTREIFEEKTKNKELLKEGEVLFVRRGSYRVGTVAMAAARDEESVVMGELLIMNVKPQNRMDITPYYLLGLLSSAPVQRQLHRLDFVDTTLPNLGDRWRELKLPIHVEAEEKSRFSDTIEKAMRKKWDAQEEIDSLRKVIGDDIVT